MIPCESCIILSACKATLSEDKDISIIDLFIRCSIISDIFREEIFDARPPISTFESTKYRQVREFFYEGYNENTM